MDGRGRLTARVWAYPQPSGADVDRSFAALSPGSFIGYWNSTPALAGGYTLAGEVARLWGAASVPSMRGLGVYPVRPGIARRRCA